MSDSDPSNTAGRLSDFDSAQRLLSAVEDDAIGEVESPTAGAAPRIPGYTIEGLLGAGGGGLVYRALADSSQRPVAIKLLTRRLGKDADAQRAWRELHILSQLRLPCLPQMLDYGEHDGRLYIVTEFIDGLSLDDYCRERNLDREARVKLLAEVAEALQSLHEHGVIHRDIKPGNILVNSHDQPVIVDLGIATLLTDDVMETLTVEGVPLGSPAFMAPEQARGDRAQTSTRSDIYGLGATAYYILTGQPPHDMEATIHEAIRRVAQDEPRDPRMLDRSLPRPLAAVLRKAVSRKPQDRYGSAAEFAADLRRWLKRDPVEAGTVSLVQRLARFIGRHPIAATVATCITIAVVMLVPAGLSAWYYDHRPYGIDVSSDGREAWLLSASGRILHIWRSPIDGGISYARLIERPSEFGGGRLALIAYSGWEDGLPGPALYAYDLQQDLNTPVWTTYPQMSELTMPPLARAGHEDQEIWFQYGATSLHDIFPNRPGQEVITSQIVATTGYTCIRILDLEGSTLCQYWHKGTAPQCYWMSEAKLLVFLAASMENTWGDPGGDGLDDLYPRVIFAIRPVLDHISDRWVYPTDAPHQERAVWYRALRPFEAVDALSSMTLAAPHTSDPKGRNVRLVLGMRISSNPTFSLLIDYRGDEVPGRRVVSDGYRATVERGDAPEPSVVYLGDLLSPDDSNQSGQPNPDEASHEPIGN